MLSLVAILIVIIVGFKYFQRYMMERYLAMNSAQAITVSAQKVHYETWEPKIRATGNLRAVLGVEVTSEVPGMVKEILLQPGTDAEKGQVLVVLSSTTDTAKLHSLEAERQLAQLNYVRDKAQFEIKAVSKAILDSSLATLETKQAEVDEQLALIEKKNIKAPFTGRLGVSSVNPGQYLNPGDKVVTLQALDPIYVDFYLPQHMIPKLYKEQEVTIISDAYPKESFLGKITTIDPKVESETRNVLIEATIANKDHQLIPGMFATVYVKLSDAQKYLTLPQTAISYNPYGDIVYLIEEKAKDKKGVPVLTVKQIFVTVGDTRGDQVAIMKGIKEGDLVVINGAHKLKNGSKVVIDNSILPENKPVPSVKDE